MPHESAACLGLYRPGPTGSPAGPLDQLPNFPHFGTGVPVQAAAQALRVLCAAPGLAAITLTEVNPSDDPAGHQLVRYVGAVADAIAHGLTSRRAQGSPAPGRCMLWAMRIFLAGASGVLGMRLVPLLVGTGHEVWGMTRSPDKAERLAALGAVPVICDVFEAAALREAVVAARPDTVMHQLTDLPDELASIRNFAAANARIRREGTRNLLEAAHAAGARRFLAQSVAWELGGDAGAATRDLERLVLAAGGVVLRYGQFWGPGTYHQQAPPPPPRVHLDEAARRTVATLSEPSGVVTIVE